jgi:sugar diacid utilization regulator
MNATSGKAERAAGPLVERLRGVHLAMVEAVVGGDGLREVARLASQAAGAPVAIVVPRLDSAVGWPRDTDVGPLRAHVADGVLGRGGRAAAVPAGVEAEVPIISGDDHVGSVLMLTGSRPPSPEAGEFLHLAAVASLTDVALEDAREEVEQNLRGSFLEELRTRDDLEPRDVLRRAGRLGCDLSRGAVVLCAELETDRPRQVVATICGEVQGALAEVFEKRVYALLPATGADDAPERTLAGARRLADRLRRWGSVGLSTFHSDPAGLRGAVHEAELVLETGMGTAQDIGTGTYRLLFRVLASHPEEVRSFYEDTVAPIVRYDDQYRTDLVGTLDSYLEHNCNMNATAAAIYAHRHTVAYRLDRVRELSGLDPTLSEDRERLGLGLKAYRIIAPRLPK